MSSSSRSSGRRTSHGNSCKQQQQPHVQFPLPLRPPGSQRRVQAQPRTHDRLERTRAQKDSEPLQHCPLHLLHTIPMQNRAPSSSSGGSTRRGRLRTPRRLRLSFSLKKPSNVPLLGGKKGNSDGIVTSDKSRPTRGRLRTGPAHLSGFHLL
jgi:hypothetical protein